MAMIKMDIGGKAIELYRMLTGTELLHEQCEAVKSMLAVNEVDGWLEPEHVLRVGDGQTMLTVRALVSLCMLRESVIWSSPTESSSRDAFYRLRGIVEAAPWVQHVPKVCVAKGDMRIEMAGAQVRFVTRSQPRIGGFTTDCFLIDGDLASPQDRAYAWLTMRSRPNPQMVVNL